MIFSCILEIGYLGSHFILDFRKDLVHHVLRSQIEIGRKNGGIVHRHDPLPGLHVKTFDLLNLIPKKSDPVSKST